MVVYWNQEMLNNKRYLIIFISSKFAETHAGKDKNNAPIIVTINLIPYIQLKTVNKIIYNINCKII